MTEKTMMTERQRKAVEIKEKKNKELYLEFPRKSIIKEDNIVLVADLRWMLNHNESLVGGCDTEPYSTPKWIYKIVGLFDAEEYMPSYFEFKSTDDLKEFIEICDYTQRDIM